MVEEIKLNRLKQVLFTRGSYLCLKPNRFLYRSKKVLSSKPFNPACTDHHTISTIAFTQSFTSGALAIFGACNQTHHNNWKHILICSVLNQTIHPGLASLWSRTASLICIYTYSVAVLLLFCTSGQITAWRVELSQSDAVNKILSCHRCTSRTKTDDTAETWQRVMCSNEWWACWGWLIVQWLECGASIVDSTVCVCCVLHCVPRSPLLMDCVWLRNSAWLSPERWPWCDSLLPAHHSVCFHFMFLFIRWH